MIIGFNSHLKGSVLIDGKDLSLIYLNSYRQHIVVVHKIIIDEATSALDNESEYYG